MKLHHLQLPTMPLWAPGQWQQLLQNLLQLLADIEPRRVDQEHWGDTFPVELREPNAEGQTQEKIHLSTTAWMWSTYFLARGIWLRARQTPDAKTVTTDRARRWAEEDLLELWHSHGMKQGEFLHRVTHEPPLTDGLVSSVQEMILLAHQGYQTYKAEEAG